MPPMIFGLFELFGEALDPGEQGSLAVAAPEVRWRPTIVVFLHAVLALAALGGLSYLILTNTWGQWGWLTLWFGLLVLYLLGAHWLIPDGDTSNFGWFGGLFDNPFRWSDDWNRFLIFLWLFLLPGRFISIGLRDGCYWLIGGLPAEPFTKRKKKRRKDIRPDSSLES